MMMMMRSMTTTTMMMMLMMIMTTTTMMIAHIKIKKVFELNNKQENKVNQYGKVIHPYFCKLFFIIM